MVRLAGWHPDPVPGAASGRTGIDRHGQRSPTDPDGRLDGGGRWGGGGLRVYLVTYGQGDAIWEPFGHNALWFHDPVAGTDIAFDWGVFTFDSDFLPRFLRGTMMYGMAASDALRAADYYESVNRRVGVQELALTPEQANELYLRVRENYQDPTYRYDYFVDNCSTRIRDMLDLVLGGAIREATAGQPEHTYRYHTRRLTQHDLPLWAGLDLLLGNPGSDPISRWEALFTPLELEEALREVNVPAPGGGTRPLVASERTVYEATRPPEPEEPAGFHWVFLVAGLVVGSALWGWGGGRRRDRPLLGGGWVWRVGPGLWWRGWWGWCSCWSGSRITCGCTGTRTCCSSVRFRCWCSDSSRLP